MTNYHLAILKRPYLEAILAGRKTIELRLTKTKCPPFGQIAVADKIFLKVSSGPVCATATVAAFKEFDNLTAERIIQLKQQYNGQIAGDEVFWRAKAEARFAVLVWLGNVRGIEPVRIDKKDWRAWVVLTEQRNFGLLKANSLK